MFRVTVMLLGCKIAKRIKLGDFAEAMHIRDLSLWVGDILVAYKLAGLTLCVCVYVCMYMQHLTFL